MPKLKPSTETISLRLPEHLLYELKLLANKNDVPYQNKGVRFIYYLTPACICGAGDFYF